VELGPGLVSAVHHHGEAESGIYIISGDARFYSGDRLDQAQEAVRAVFIKPALREYIARIIDRTRSHADIALGASTRGTINLFRAAQAWAAIAGREYVLPDDVKELAEPILAHRLILRPNAEMQGQTTRKILAQLLEREPVPQLSGDE